MATKKKGPSPADFIPLRDTAEHYRNRLTGVTITRRAFDTLRRGAQAATGTPLSVKGVTERRYYRVVERLARGESLAQASRAEHINAESVKKLNSERGLFQTLPRMKKTSSGMTRPTGVRGYRVDTQASTPILESDGTLIMGPDVDKKYAGTLGKYWNAVDDALKGKPQKLQTFGHTVIYTTDGQSHTLLTDVNAIRFVLNDVDNDFERNFYSKGTYYENVA